MTSVGFRLERLAVPPVSAGTRSELTVLRFGADGSRPKAYLQASLHADEIPGMLAINHLLQRLREGDERVVGELVIVPVANPLGLAQCVSGRLVGRFALTGAGNYNRHFPWLAREPDPRLADRLGADPQHNVSVVREHLAGELAALAALDETQWLRHTLMGLALDADIVLDLHCDDEALLHVYTGTPLWPAAADLSRQLASEVTLLADESGGNAFDEAVAGPWWRLAKRFDAHPLPPACLAATVELRGNGQLDDARAALDADNLFRFLQRRGVIDGDPGPLPELRRDATPLEAVDLVRAPSAGIVAELVPLGTNVLAGDVVARLADPLEVEDPRRRHEVRAAGDGLVFARTEARMARPGTVLCKIAGERALAHRSAGDLLTD